MSIEHRLTAPPDALGALYFLPGQYLFKRIESGRESAKALSSEQISLAFREFRTDSGWLTRRILRYREEPEGNFVLSYEPAGIRTIFVENRNGEVVETKLPLPTLILLGKGNEYYLWAAKDRRRVTIKTKLAIAPLPNIGGDLSGKICFGKNEVPEAKIDGIDEIWNLIFNTPFNADHSANKCRSEPKDARNLLASLAKKKAKTFPASELLESNTTIEDMWQSVSPEKRYFPDHLYN
jgi:PRTRC genetic system protein B